MPKKKIKTKQNYSINRDVMINNKISLYQGDCLDIMDNIDSKSIDLIICDLPYGVTRNKWDIVIPFDKLWKHYNRIIKDNGAIILFGSQPFTTLLISSNMKYFRYSLVWEKNKFSDFLNAKRKPMKIYVYFIKNNLLIIYNIGIALLILVGIHKVL